jgi:hypothetical protein
MSISHTITALAGIQAAIDIPRGDGIIELTELAGLEGIRRDLVTELHRDLGLDGDRKPLFQLAAAQVHAVRVEFADQLAGEFERIAAASRAYHYRAALKRAATTARTVAAGG